MREQFENKLEKGHQHEELLASLITKTGLKVTNVSQDENCYYKGDLILHRNGKQYYIDVKSDYQISVYGNFFFELGLRRYTGYYDGWFVKGEYDFVAFDDNIGNFYIINFKKAKELVPSIYKRITDNWNDNENARIKGYLVSVEKAKEYGLIMHTYKYKVDKSILISSAPMEHRHRRLILPILHYEAYQVV